MHPILRMTICLPLLLLLGDWSTFFPFAKIVYADVNCTDPAIECRSGALQSDETWTADKVYVIDGDFSIPSGRTLTIQSGVVVKFLYYGTTAQKVDFAIQGTLTINGAAASRVYFTSSRDDSIGGDTNGDGSASAPFAGDWNGMRFEGGSSGTINYAEIRYTGYSFGGISTISMENSSPTLNHVTINHSAWNAIYLSNSSPQLNNLLIKNTNRAAISALPTDQPQITNFSAETTEMGGLEIRQSILGTADVTWSLTGIVYIISGDFSVSTGAKLTIQPGVVVKFLYYGTTVQKVDFTVQGTLTINGTAGSRVYFTSTRDDSVGGDTNGDRSASAPFAGDWNGMRFEGGSSGTISYAEIRYTGQGFGEISSISMENSAPTLNHVTIDHSGWNAIYLNNSSPQLDHITVRNTYNAAISALPSDNPQITNFSATTTGMGGLEIRQSVLGSANVTWGLTGIVYIINSDFSIATGAQLTIQPGVVVKLSYYGTSAQKVDFDVQGMLTISGTATSRVYFTSIRDDSIGGDTNGDGNSSAPFAGDWRSIRILPEGTATIHYAEIRYGGYLTDYGAVHAIGNTTLKLSRVVLSRNTVGLYAALTSVANAATTMAVPEIRLSTIANNTQRGIIAAPGTTVSANDNWWGSATGPGSSIQGNVVANIWCSDVNCQSNSSTIYLPHVRR